VDGLLERLLSKHLEALCRSGLLTNSQKKEVRRALDSLTSESIFLIRQFFKGIPEELFDAARIDGASEFGVWWRIAMPISTPVLAAVSIFAFQFAWNDFLYPLIYLGSNQQHWTLALGLNALQGFEGNENTLNVMMTFSVLMLIPVLIMFYFGQQYLIKGVSVTGVKG
jgi:ABC-type glycerol-3-phosphate transport system permease component